MKIETIKNKLLDVNTYFIVNDQKCLVVDPGSDDKKIIDYINQENLELEGIVLTHAHFDHCLSANMIALMFKVPIFVHKLDLELLYDGRKNASTYFYNGRSFVIDQKVRIETINEETKQIGSIPLSILHVPGHSPGGVAIYLKGIPAVITGDTLFSMSIGRSDLYNGDETQLIKNIKTKLLKLNDQTLVYPGHGESSTIAYEKKYNLFLR